MRFRLINLFELMTLFAVVLTIGLFLIQVPAVGMFCLLVPYAVAMIWAVWYLKKKERP